MYNKTAAVVVTYNRKDLLIKNIKSLLDQTYNDVLDILIFDNASSKARRHTVF